MPGLLNLAIYIINLPNVPLDGCRRPHAVKRPPPPPTPWIFLIRYWLRRFVSLERHILFLHTPASTSY